MNEDLSYTYGALEEIKGLRQEQLKEYKVYLAAPFGTPGSFKRSAAESAARILVEKGFKEVYKPWTVFIPHAWDYPNNEWAQMVFINDVRAINEADIVVVLSYGRESTAGTNWEAGYAFGIGKKVIIVEMTNDIMSLMVANGRYATVSDLKGLEEYDFVEMPQSRTFAEQK